MQRGASPDQELQVSLLPAAMGLAIAHFHHKKEFECNQSVLRQTCWLGGCLARCLLHWQPGLIELPEPDPARMHGTHAPGLQTVRPLHCLLPACMLQHRRRLHGSERREGRAVLP